MSCCGGLNQILTLNVPNGYQSDGTPLDVSGLVGDKSIEISGNYDGSYTIYGSNDGVLYVPILTFNSGSGSQAFKQTTSFIVKWLKVRQSASNITSPVSILVAAQAAVNCAGSGSAGANQFIAFNQILPGAQGAGSVVDLWTLVSSTGLDPGFNVMCGGEFVGTIIIEGSNDGVRFTPIGQDAQGSSIGGFTAGRQSSSPAAQPNPTTFSPLVVNNVVRYVRTRVGPSTTITGPVSVTLGGSQNCPGTGTGGVSSVSPGIGISVSGPAAAPIVSQANIVLPPAWRTKFMALGDSQTSGFLSLGSQPHGTMVNNVTAGGTANQADNFTSLTVYATDAAAIRDDIYQIVAKLNSLGVRMSVGADGTGAYRTHLLELCFNNGILIPTFQWIQGTFQSTDGNLPGASSGGYAYSKQQGQPGYQLSDIANAFPGWYSFNPCPAILLMGGTNDWAVYLMAHPGDYAGAAAYAATNLSGLLGVIKATAGANTVVAFMPPPTGNTHKTEALLSLPLFRAAVAAAAAGGQSTYFGYDNTTATVPGALNLFTGLMCGDDVHMNEQGNRIVGAGALQTILMSPY
jgi:hypothetical protein